MCLSSGGGGGETKAPVAGGYTELTIDDGSNNKDYKLYDNSDNEITNSYKLDKKKKTVTKSGSSGVEDAAQYLYTRDA
jgi:hypothetical protein